MGDLHGQNMTTVPDDPSNKILDGSDHQKEKYDGKAEGSNAPLSGSQRPKDSDIMIAADLNLYASPMTILQSCKKTGQIKKESADKSGSRSSSSDHMIAADLRKYGNPLDEK